MNNLYLRFLQVVKTLDSQTKFSTQIDATAMLLLNEIAVKHFERKNMTVSQAMSLKNIASPATIHRKIEDLLKVGLVDLIFEGKNRRTKFLAPNKSAKAFLKKCLTLSRKLLIKNLSSVRGRITQKNNCNYDLSPKSFA